MTDHEPDPRPDQRAAAAEAGAREGKAAPTPAPWVQGDNEHLGPATRRHIYAAALATDPSGDDAPLVAEFKAVPFGPEEAEANARLACAAPAFARACLGTGAPGEPTPLDALDHLMDAFILGDRLPRTEWEAVERLARELRAAVGRAEGDPE